MSVIQKKICMVGVAGTGKTSLVRQFVDSRFSEKYHSTVGVKIDRKTVELDRKTVNLLLWDLAGRTEEHEITPTYLRGSAGIILVVDGTRRVTFDQVFDLHQLAQTTIGSFPCAVALNKKDLAEQWALTAPDYDRLRQAGWHVLPTSAKTGEGVEATFHWLATETLRGPS